MNRITRTLAAVALIAAVATPPSPRAKAQYPSKTIECYAPSGAGGGWDMTIRTVSKALTDDQARHGRHAGEQQGRRRRRRSSLAYSPVDEGQDNVLDRLLARRLLLINLNGSTPFGVQGHHPAGPADHRLRRPYVVRKDSKYTSITQVIAGIKKEPNQRQDRRQLRGRARWTTSSSSSWPRPPA
ncbi:MAG: hypothetical protein MZV70_67960 [Desulfobacterales bacterium]|nr:hypothetical protein [Desulfobacterales bacterium]